MAKEIKVSGYKINLYEISVYVNKNKDSIQVEFKIGFRKFFRNHSQFSNFYQNVKLGNVIRKEIINLIEERLVDFNIKLIDEDYRELRPILELNRGYKEKLLRVYFNSNFTTDMTLLSQQLNQTIAKSNYIQYEIQDSKA